MSLPALESHFDVIVLGTGLVESITAAALAKAGIRVAHIDNHPYYGSDQASLSLEEFIEWESQNGLVASHPAGALLPQGRQYSFSLAPSIIPAVGPLIKAIVASGVAKYGGFRLLERLAIYRPSGVIKSVPGSKEDIFKNKDLTLLDKRRLMRFLLFAAGDFESSKELVGNAECEFRTFLERQFKLIDELADFVVYALALCSTSTESTLPALNRVRKHLLSTGRYGPSSFLVGHYGGLGEISQGFCRAAAVLGAVYILNQKINSISQRSECYEVVLQDFPDVLTADVLITNSRFSTTKSPSNQSMIGKCTPHFTARCIAVLDAPIAFAVDLSFDAETEQTEEIDTALLVFPPGSLSTGSPDMSVHVLMTGAGTMSAPAGKFILYLSMQLPISETRSAKTLLEPYLKAAQSTSTHRGPTLTLFQSFYIEESLSHLDTIPPILEQDRIDAIIASPIARNSLSEIGDTAAEAAESTFWEAVQALKTRRPEREIAIEAVWPLMVVNEDNDEDDV